MPLDPALQEALHGAADRLIRGWRLLVLAGAGLSADAGVPTFRDPEGWWNQVRPEDLASRDGFDRDPELVWRWYRERRLHIAGCQPHEGQRSLALLEGHFPGRVLVATTNEDDLLERDGVRELVHLHGDLYTTSCLAACGWSSRDDLDNRWSFLPCPACGGDVRPGSVWFGEELPAAALAVLERFNADACLVVGSSSLVQPVAAIPPEMALAGAPVVEVNPVATPLSAIAAVRLAGSAKEVLPRLVDLLTSPTVRGRSRRPGRVSSRRPRVGPV